MSFAAYWNAWGAEYMENGFEAVDAVRYDGYDLVLMDQAMPALEGTETARMIRELPDTDPLPIVAISLEQDQRRACLEAGMDQFLIKPVAKYRFKQILTRFVPAYTHRQPAEARAVGM